MKWKSYTVWFILFTSSAIAIYDVIAIKGGGVEASISHQMILWSYQFPLFPFSMGLIMGHLFWRMRDTKETKSLTNGEK